MIVAIATIEREAREAAAKFKTPREACRYPLDSDAGRRWRRIYDEEREALALSHARGKYAASIEESSCLH